MTDLFNLRKQLAFYGAYHSNPSNQLVHILCVPLILWSAIMLLCNQTDIFGSNLAPFTYSHGPLSLISYTEKSPEYHELLILNWGFVVMMLYAIYYVILEPVAGSMATVLLFAAWLSGNAFRKSYPDHFVIVFFATQICSWTPQLLSHKYFEGRAPALKDNLAQAFLLAPFFVFLEVLFKFGYRADIHESIQKEAQKNIDAWKKSQQTASSKKAQ